MYGVEELERQSSSKWVTVPSITVFSTSLWQDEIAGVYDVTIIFSIAGMQYVKDLTLQQQPDDGNNYMYDSDVGHFKTRSQHTRHCLVSGPEKLWKETAEV